MDLYLMIGLGISLLLNLILFFLMLKKKKTQPPNITFDEAFCILNSVIETHRTKFFKGLKALSKKYMILGNDGQLSSPNDSIDEYSKKKKELKTAITKKIIRNISIDLRKKILVYYSENGLLNYIITELDKESELEGVVK